MRSGQGDSWSTRVSGRTRAGSWSTVQVRSPSPSPLEAGESTASPPVDTLPKAGGSAAAARLCTMYGRVSLRNGRRRPQLEVSHLDSRPPHHDPSFGARFGGGCRGDLLVPSHGQGEEPGVPPRPVARDGGAAAPVPPVGPGVQFLKVPRIGRTEPPRCPSSGLRHSLAGQPYEGANLAAGGRGPAEMR